MGHVCRHSVVLKAEWMEQDDWLKHLADAFEAFRFTRIAEIKARRLASIGEEEEEGGPRHEE